MVFCIASAISIWPARARKLGTMAASAPCAEKTFSISDTPRSLARVKRADYTAAAFIKYMRVNHLGFHIGMTEQFLHRADVVAAVEQMRCKAVAQGVRFQECADR